VYLLRYKAIWLFTLLALSSLIVFPLFYFVFLTLTTSGPCPTIVQLPSDSSLWPLPRNYRTYPLIVRVGTTHKLKPSPTCYPLLITHWPSPTQLQTSDSGLPPELTPNSIIRFIHSMIMPTKTTVKTTTRKPPIWHTTDHLEPSGSSPQLSNMPGLTDWFASVEQQEQFLQHTLC